MAKKTRYIGKRFKKGRNGNLKRSMHRIDPIEKALQESIDRSSLAGASVNRLPPTVLVSKEAVLKTYDGKIPRSVPLPDSDYEYVFSEVTSGDMTGSILIEPKLKRAWVIVNRLGMTAEDVEEQENDSISSES